MKAVLLGATRGMGRSVARALADRGASMFLLGRNAQELAKSASDLEQRGAVGSVGHAPCDLLDPSAFAAALDTADAALDGFDTVIVTAGLFGTQEQLESDLELAGRVLTANYVNTVLFCEHVRTRLLARGGGALCVFSSVAGDRGRKPVALYGSSKAGLSHYLESLDHKHRSEGLVTLCVKPGFVKTSMTEGLKPAPFAGEPDQVAAVVVRALERKAPLVYAPFPWGWIMLVIKLLPRFIMRRVGF
ncbi:MAG: decaprenylphospho-beta-D-erythro-pentofuranosid-2-ulose 2-reductase [Myxococcota bacterium]|jgi:decaprenylphospho-beta-D-erythro-pentofuranosid-2-ulose 2-reductase